MLNLPFHIERPLATAIVVGVVALLFTILWWSFEKNYLFSRDVLLSYFRRRLGALEPKKAETAAKLFLAGMAVDNKALLTWWSLTVAVVFNLYSLL